MSVNSYANSAFEAANSAGSYANSAFAAANAATATDTTQNNSITAAFTAANSAGVYANGAFATANSAGVYANGAFATANTANAVINTKTTINALNFLSAPSSNTQNTIFLVVDLQTGTPTTKKLSLSVLSERSANFAFQAANSAGSYANGAFAAATSAGSYANSAFAAANAAFLAANAATATDTTQNNSITAAFTAANSAGVYANGAFAKANTQDAINLTQNNSITAAFTAANAATNTSITAAFTAANSAGSYANSAFNAANSAAIFANTPSHVANSASIYANAATATDTTQNNSITAAFNTANASFIHANSSFGAANVSANLTLSFGATTILEVTHSGSSAYLFSQYDSLNNPNVSAFSATTLGFKLNVTGHPFQIRLGNNTANFDTGLVHVSPTGNLSYGSAAQGQVNGTLFWRIPHNAVGNYKYRCTNHPSVMIGEINVANTAGIYFAYNS